MSLQQLRLCLRVFCTPTHALCSCVQVKGKCNAISIDKCQKTGVVFEDVIASCELINCSSVQVCSHKRLSLC